MIKDEAYRERHREYSRRYYERNREKHRERVMRWREENPERARETLREAVRKYGAANRAVLRRRDARRRLRMKGVWTQAGDDYAAFIDGEPCAYCGGVSQGIDHIVPIAKGGTHTPDNLAPACFDCNRRKHAKPLLRFLLGVATSGPGRRPEESCNQRPAPVRGLAAVMRDP